MLKQGQGICTGDKERGLGHAFAVNLRVFTGRFNEWNYPYFHFDLNSGGGWNYEANCIGSPLAFLQQANNHACEKFFAGFCDIDKKAVIELLRRPEIANDDRCHVFHGDNKGLIESIPQLIKAYGDKPDKAIGMVLSDPNGAGIPVDELEWLSYSCPKIDLVLHWNSTQFKRNRGAFGDDRPTMKSALDRLNKRYWLIRKPLGRWQWTLLVGRNIACGGSRALGFYPLASREGQEFFNTCNFKPDERPEDQYIPVQMGLL